MSVPKLSKVNIPQYNDLEIVIDNQTDPDEMEIDRV